jgi:hypothetical protein
MTDRADFRCDAANDEALANVERAGPHRVRSNNTPRSRRSMMNKPGYQTTEFWLVAAMFALVVLNKTLGLGLNAQELIGLGLGVAGYPVGRGLAKQKTP